MLFDAELLLVCLTLYSQEARASASAAQPLTTTTSGAPDSLTLTVSQLAAAAAAPTCNSALALAMAREVLHSSGSSTSSISLPAFSASTTSECSLARLQQQHRPPFNSPASASASPLAALQQQRLRRQQVARTKRQRSPDSSSSHSASDARPSDAPHRRGKRAHIETEAEAGRAVFVGGFDAGSRLSGLVKQHHTTPASHDEPSVCSSPSLSPTPSPSSLSRREHVVDEAAARAVDARRLHWVLPSGFALAPPTPAAFPPSRAHAILRRMRAFQKHFLRR